MRDAHEPDRRPEGLVTVVRVAHNRSGLTQAAVAAAPNVPAAQAAPAWTAPSRVPRAPAATLYLRPIRGRPTVVVMGERGGAYNRLALVRKPMSGQCPAVNRIRSGGSTS